MPKRCTITDAERFWSFVDKTADCWVWTGGKAPRGYGTYTTLRPDHKSHRAHRYSYELAHGPIPSGMCVCHSCDNPGCVNPAHMWLGTTKDNNRDKAAKGRAPKGSKHRNSKLTEAQVIEIRSRFEAGETAKALAAVYGVCYQHIHLLVKQQSWGWLIDGQEAALSG